MSLPEKIFLQVYQKFLGKPSKITWDIKTVNGIKILVGSDIIVFFLTLKEQIGFYKRLDLQNELNEDHIGLPFPINQKSQRLQDTYRKSTHKSLDLSVSGCSLV